MSSFVRLNAALTWITTSDYLADIGCDHGYLAIEALKNIEEPFLKGLYTEDESNEANV
jgi:tRNA A22 N-methylase